MEIGNNVIAFPGRATWGADWAVQGVDQGLKLGLLGLKMPIIYSSRYSAKMQSMYII